MRCSLIILGLGATLLTGCLYRANYYFPPESNGTIKRTVEVKESFYNNHTRLERLCRGVFHRISTQKSPLSIIVPVQMEDVEVECGKRAKKSGRKTGAAG